MIRFSSGSWSRRWRLGRDPLPPPDNNNNAATPVVEAPGAGGASPLEPSLHIGSFAVEVLTEKYPQSHSVDDIPETPAYLEKRGLSVEWRSAPP